MAKTTFNDRNVVKALIDDAKESSKKIFSIRRRNNYCETIYHTRNAIRISK
jgi:hypothetical protein